MRPRARNRRCRIVIARVGQFLHDAISLYRTERNKEHYFRRILQIRRETVALKRMPLRVPIGIACPLAQLKRIAAIFLFRQFVVRAQRCF